MNNPAIKRLAKELKEIQNFEVDSDEVFPVGEDFIEAAPLAVKQNLVFVFPLTFTYIYIYIYLCSFV